MTGDNLAWLAGPCPAGVWRRVIDAEQPGGTPFVRWGRVDEPEAVRLLAAANPATMDRATARELAELLRLWADGEGAAHV